MTPAPAERRGAQTWDGRRKPPALGRRRYRGVTPAERGERRRERLLEAGLELFGTGGYARTTVRAVCATANLNPRYFYESFGSSEDLLCELYDVLVAEVAGAVLEATGRASTVEEQARAGLTAVWRIMSEDPRKARVLLVEVEGASDRIERLRRRDRQVFADILVRNALSLVPPDVKLRFDPLLNARALMGASTELLRDWAHGERAFSEPEIVEYLVELFVTMARAALSDGGTGGARAGGRRTAGGRRVLGGRGKAVGDGPTRPGDTVPRDS